MFEVNANLTFVVLAVTLVVVRNLVVGKHALTHNYYVVFCCCCCFLCYSLRNPRVHLYRY